MKFVLNGARKRIGSRISRLQGKEEIEKYIGVDSLAYISLDGLYRAMGEENRSSDTPQYCDACFSGEYPVDLTDHDNNWTGAKVTNLRERHAKNS